MKIAVLFLSLILISSTANAQVKGKAQLDYIPAAEAEIQQKYQSAMTKAQGDLACVVRLLESKEVLETLEIMDSQIDEFHDLCKQFRQEMTLHCGFEIGKDTIDHEKLAEFRDSENEFRRMQYQGFSLKYSRKLLTPFTADQLIGLGQLIPGGRKLPRSITEGALGVFLRLDEKDRDAIREDFKKLQKKLEKIEEEMIQEARAVLIDNIGEKKVKLLDNLYGDDFATYSGMSDIAQLHFALEWMESKKK